MADYLLAIDQGTTSTRTILFDAALTPVATAQQELRQIYPAPGWVEHDPEEIWSATVATARAALAQAGVDAGKVAGIGITNQRETTILWDRASGKPIHNAIVWQDRRTADMCASLRQAGHEGAVAASTGLLLDPYFSATKIRWLIDHAEGAGASAQAGRLAFGTVDSFLLWRLTGGRVHASDATNAARTMLFDIGRGEWDLGLCEIFGVPPALLPSVCDCAHDFGTTEPALFGGGISILGLAGDQQAATVGQGCFTPGMIKSTYGTGCFALLNTGAQPVASQHRLLTTIAYQLAGKRTYALEGARAAAGRLAFGTVDTFLLWRLTGGRVHATDATNAARTLLLDIHTGAWDDALAALFGVPAALLPQVRDCAGDFGTTEPGLFGGPIRILGVAGDQQAATIGQGCFRPGMIKSTYGTGCFALLNTGEQVVRSNNRLLSTIAYQLEGKRTYALEAAIFVAGAAVQWLRDGLKLIATAAETAALAAAADPAEQVYLVPAFVGLGAPYWDSNARGALYGLTRKSGRAEFARAALEAVGYQTRDLIEAMRADWPEASGAETVLRVDGGMTESEWVM
ncbi:MAG TPA: FGGY family carbohydrate kinase, partial [Xanthobacteraceae bacterium]